jgi:hypothetical protein
VRYVMGGIVIYEGFVAGNRISIIHGWSSV